MSDPSKPTPESPEQQASAYSSAGATEEFPDKRPIVVPSHPKEVVRHALGHKEPVNGQIVDTAEERRRMERIKFELARHARKQRIPVESSSPFPSDVPTSLLGVDISKQAAPLMQRASDDATLVYQTFKTTHADGSVTEAKNVQINIFGPAKEVCMKLAELAKTTLKGKLSVALKVGKWFDFRAKGEGTQE